MFDSLDALHQARVKIHSDRSSSSSQPLPNESHEEIVARLLDEDYVIRHFCNIIHQCVGPLDPDRGKEPAYSHHFFCFSFFFCNC